MPESSCTLCPRRCGASRTGSDMGCCGVPREPVIARAAPHFGEEPCISGSRGSGAVFFSGCALGCVFCQNRDISRGGTGRVLRVERLREILLELQDAGVHNINFVTPSHFTPVILRALDGLPLSIPVVWNSSGYESVETLQSLAGRVQIYMPDMKYEAVFPLSTEIAPPPPHVRYCDASDYPERAKAAIEEMYRQVGPYRMDRDGLLLSGLLIRHLILPGQTENTRRVIAWVSKTFEPGTILFSLMSQYTPCAGNQAFPELSRGITRAEYEFCLRCLTNSRIETGYTQGLDASGTEAIPAFDLTGVC